MGIKSAILNNCDRLWEGPRHSSILIGGTFLTIRYICLNWTSLFSRRVHQYHAGRCIATYYRSHGLSSPSHRYFVCHIWEVSSNTDSEHKASRIGRYYVCLNVSIFRFELKLALSFIRFVFEDVLWCIPSAYSRFVQCAPCYRELYFFMNFRCIASVVLLRAPAWGRLFRVPHSFHFIQLYTIDWESPSSLGISLGEKSLPPSRWCGFHFTISACLASILRKVSTSQPRFHGFSLCHYDVTYHRTYFPSYLTHDRISHKIDTQIFRTINIQ